MKELMQQNDKDSSSEAKSERKQPRLSKRNKYIIAIVAATLIMVFDVGFCFSVDMFGAAGQSGYPQDASFEQREFGSRSRPSSSDGDSGSFAANGMHDGTNASTDGRSGASSSETGARDGSTVDAGSTAGAAPPANSSDNPSASFADDASDGSQGDASATAAAGNSTSMQEPPESPAQGEGASSRPNRSSGRHRNQDANAVGVGLPVKVGAAAVFLLGLVVDIVSIIGLVRLRRKEDAPTDGENGSGNTPEDPVEARQKKQRRQRIAGGTALAVLVAAIAILQFIGASDDKSNGESVDERVVSANVELGDIQKTLATFGTVASAGEEDMSVPGDIRVLDYNVSVGDVVAKGDIIATVDRNTVLAAIADIQELIDDLDAEVAAIEEASSSDELTAAAAGTVVKVYAAAGDAVTDVMYENGALMLASLDGLYGLKLEGAGALTVGDAVLVSGDDGVTYDGQVAAVEKESVTVTVPLEHFSFGQMVEARDESGKTLGSGELFVYSQQKITGYSGSVSSVNVAEGSTVSIGDTLLTLSNADHESDVQVLLNRRKKLVDQSAILTAISKDGTVRAEEDGVIASLNENLVVDPSSATQTQNANGSAASTQQTTSATAATTSTAALTKAGGTTAATPIASTTRTATMMRKTGTGTQMRVATLKQTTENVAEGHEGTVYIQADGSGNAVSAQADGSGSAISTQADGKTDGSGSAASTQADGSTDGTDGANSTASSDSSSSSSSSSSSDPSGSSDSSSSSETVVKTASIVWISSDGSALSQGMPDSITIRLFANGQGVSDSTAGEESDWLATFEVPKYDDEGNQIDYTIGLPSSIDGFTLSTSVSGNRTNLVLRANANEDETADDANGSQTSSSSSSSASASSASSRASSPSSSSSRSGSNSSSSASSSSGKGSAAPSGTSPQKSSGSNPSGKSGASQRSSGAAAGGASGGSDSSGSGLLTSDGDTIADAEAEATSTYTYGQTVLCTITPSDTVSIDVSVDELDVGNIVVGTPVQVTLDALPGQSFSGKISALDPSGVNSGGNTKYTVSISLDKQENMLLGMNASVSIDLESLENVPTIPEAALVEQDGKTLVYTSYDQATDELGNPVEVTCGVADGTNVQIASGLEEGQAYYYRYAETISYQFK